MLNFSRVHLVLIIAHLVGLPLFLLVLFFFLSISFVKVRQSYHGWKLGMLIKPALLDLSALGSHISTTDNLTNLLGSPMEQITVQQN